MTIRLNPYLSFRDNAREAMEFYHSVFGGTLTSNTFAEYQVRARTRRSSAATGRSCRTVRTSARRWRRHPGVTPSACAPTGSGSPGW